MELLLFTSTALHEHGEHPEILCGVHITIYILQNCAFLSAYMQRLLHFRCVFCVCVAFGVNQTNVPNGKPSLPGAANIKRLLI